MPKNALQQMAPTPRSKVMGLFADALTQGRDFANRAQIPQGVPMIGGQGVGSLLLGKAPEELNEWSYGNAPMRINPLAGRTAGYMPEMKPGRGQQVADTLFAAQVPGGRNALAMGMGAMDGGAAKAIFMGAKSKTWDAASAERALKLEKAGADPRAIWSETGTFKGADGKWRQEIDDSAMSVDYQKLTDIPQLGLIGDLPRAHSIISHKPLYDAYPQISGSWVSKQADGGGSFENLSGSGPFKAKVSIGVDRPSKVNSVAAHELQHGVQDIERFASGGNPGMSALSAETKRIYDEALPQFGGTPEQLLEMAKMNTYRRLAGEAEARAVQSRMNLTPAQRRALFPFDSYDVPQNALIVR